MKTGFKRIGSGGQPLSDGTVAVALIEAAVYEVMLFAAFGYLIGGFDDLLIDALYLIRLVKHRLYGWQNPVLADLPIPDARAGRMAILVPAWDEGAVIGSMLRTALARLEHPDWRIYVGAYPNDRATIHAVADVAATDPRIRLVIGQVPGPTTKADCLNTIWRALLTDEAADGQPVRAVALHDAEDVVHRHELRVQSAMLARGFHVVQLPVLPLVDQRSRMVAGHYADEFSESHAKQLLVRQVLGAAIPLAGTGCAIDRDMLGRVAARRGGLPFDAQSLTEDYELGLMIGVLGGRATFARVTETPGGQPVAVRAFFPAGLHAAVRQKARWMTGIALAGWDRTGWAHPLALGDHWMRMRDRRAILAVLILLAAYVSLAGWAALGLLNWWMGRPATPIGPALSLMLGWNAAMLGWRTAMRMIFVGTTYGRVEALLSVPRIMVANLISLLAARRAMFTYIRMLRGGATQWDKTEHHFPDLTESTP